jgi:hypothetical protein
MTDSGDSKWIEGEKDERKLSAANGEVDLALNESRCRAGY